MSATAINFDPQCCSICGIRKGETNHWRILGCFTYEDGVRKLQITDWTEVDVHDALALKSQIQLAVACGEAHTLQLVSRFLETGSFSAPAVRSESAQKGRSE